MRFNVQQNNQKKKQEIREKMYLSRSSSKDYKYAFGLINHGVGIGSEWNDLYEKNECYFANELYEMHRRQKKKKTYTNHSLSNYSSDRKKREKIITN